MTIAYWPPRSCDGAVRRSSFDRRESPGNTQGAAMDVRHGLWFPRQHARYPALHRSVRFRAALRVVSFGTVCASGAFDRIPTQHAGGQLCALNPCSSSVLSDVESVGAAGPRGIRRLGNVHRLGRVGVGRVGVGRVGHRLRLVLREFGVAVIRLVGHVRIVPRWVPQLMEPLEEPLGKG
jgi:hypothetical protein